MFEIFLKSNLNPTNFLLSNKFYRNLPGKPGLSRADGQYFRPRLLAGTGRVDIYFKQNNSAYIKLIGSQHDQNNRGVLGWCHTLRKLQIQEEKLY